MSILDANYVLRKKDFPQATPTILFDLAQEFSQTMLQVPVSPKAYTRGETDSLIIAVADEFSIVQDYVERGDTSIDTRNAFDRAVQAHYFALVRLSCFFT